ncbi:MAG: tRNA pseudouridine(38-40) synthase TruA [Nocardioidaceae bacterium]
MPDSHQTPDVTRLRIDVAYDGTNFSGWASQPGRRTVQATLETALATILRLTDVRLTVAGRTDVGVHARGQVAHVDIPAESGAELGAEAICRRLAGVLPEDVRVRRVVQAPTGFDARFSASWRRYSYRVCDDSSGVDPLDRHAVLAWPRQLDVGAINRSAQRLMGEHDFAAFCKQRAGATTIRTLLECTWTRDGNVLTGAVVADAFCHHMVRAVVGCLLLVGEAAKPERWPAEVLAGRVRDPRVQVVAPRGLSLDAVGYPADDQLADRAQASRAVRTLSPDGPAVEKQ